MSMRTRICLMLCLFFISLGCLRAQTLFNSIYSLDYPTCIFVNAVFANNKIYTYGIFDTDVNVNGSNDYGVVLSICDTNGILLSRHPFLSPLGIGLGADDNFAIRILSNGTIAISAGYFVYNKEQLLLFDTSGSLLLDKVINYDFGHNQYELLEINSGFLFGGNFIPPDSDNKCFITKTDNQGNIQWRKEYGDSTVFSYGVFDIKAVNDSIFMVASVEATWDWGRSYLFTVDGNGEMLSSFKSPLGEETAATSLEYLPNGRIIYTTNKISPLPSPIEKPSISKIVCRDTAFNLIWEKEVSPTNWYQNRIVDMKPTPDGNFVLAAKWAPGSNFETPEWAAGCLYKFTPDGEELWMVCDTPRWGVPTPLYYQDMYVGGLTVLPSGSVVLVGRADRWFQPPIRSFGWMFKVDANGCQYAPCQVSATEPQKPVMLKVYPNPGRGVVTLRLPDLPQGGRLEVFDAFGRKVQEKPTDPSVEMAYLDTTNWPPGTYIVQVNASGGRLVGVAKLLVSG